MFNGGIRAKFAIEQRSGVCVLKVGSEIRLGYIIREPSFLT